MGILKQTVENISADFLSEAKNSPRLLEDMASMEKYMAESYSGRIFVELLQNADDSGSNKVLLTEQHGHIIFANSGRCFNGNDVLSISRSGASFKERGSTIGYRGIGFKSTTYLTSEIIIFSDNIYFTFSKSICAKALSKTEDRIPTVRIPFLSDNIDAELDNYVQLLNAQGFNTIFVFKYAKINEFLGELYDISNGYFLFLNNINNCVIDVRDCKKIFTIDRKSINTNTLIITISGNNKESWVVIVKGSTSVAFKYSVDNRIVPCEDNEALYHCYLPTFDKVAFPIKVNSDFSTDPSRKHLNFDETTEKAILRIADLIFDIICNVFLGNHNLMFYNILSILTTSTSSFSKANTLLKGKVRENIISTEWLLLNSGKRISPKDYKVLPEWLEDSEKNIIRRYSGYVNSHSLQNDIYANVSLIESFLSQYSNNKFSIDELIEIMEDSDFVSSINSQTQGKMIANIIKAGKASQFISGQNYDYSQILVSTNDNVATIKDIARNSSISFDDDVKAVVNENISSTDIEWFCKENKLNIEAIKLDKDPINDKESEFIIKINPISAPVINNTPMISRWRSAEQQCIEFEKYLGNKALDVSKQNVGYDIESTNSDGSKRYIEVKLLAKNSSSFTITNNEYTAAHQYGEKYFICLIKQDENEAKMTYINNPLKKLNFEKRVRQWEWYCEQYNGDEYIVSMK